eukprot:gene5648-5709_t
MRLLQIIASVDPAHGGPVEGLFQQARLCADHGVEIHVASLDPPESPHVQAFPAKVFALGQAVDGLRRRTPLARYGYQPKAMAWLQAHIADYDAVVVNGLWNYSTMAARRALVGRGVPYAVFTHGMLDPWFRKTYPLKNLAKQLFWLVCEGPLLNRADAVLFTTRDELIVSNQAFWPYRVKGEVVGYGTSVVEGNRQAQIDAFRAQMPELDGRRYLLFLSRIHEKKGIDLLIKAFATIADAQPDLDLVIAGPDSDGLKAELQVLATELGVGRRIHWPGMLTGDAKWGAFKGCEAFALSSHQENFGVVVAEALVCGKIVLISDKVQVWREVQDHAAGFVADDTFEGTAGLLESFVNMAPETRATMERNAENLFYEKFDLTKVIDNLFVTLSTITRSRRMPRA